MTQIPAAPGFSIAAQLREQRAQERRRLRKEVERAERTLREKQAELEKAQLALNGKNILARGQRKK